jgi:flavodoxin
MKKVLILYDSIYGNTKKVAMSLSRGLEEGGLHVDCKTIINVDFEDLGNYNAIGIGGPTHFHGASKNMKTFLRNLKKYDLRNKLGFAFDTRADFRLAGSANKRIARYLKKVGLMVVYPSISGIVLGNQGPLEDGTLIIMEKTGLAISDEINNRGLKN